MRIRRFRRSVLKASIAHRPLAARPALLLMALLLLLPVPVAPPAGIITMAQRADAKPLRRRTDPRGNMSKGQNRTERNQSTRFPEGSILLLTVLERGFEFNLLGF